MTDAEDRVLAASVAAARDGRAFGRLYDRHTPYLYRLALRLAGGDASSAEDIVHDAWVRAVERFRTFAGRSALRTWLAGFVVNCAREHTRALARHEALADLELGADDGALTALADRVDLEGAIAGLPPGYRHVFVLHDVEGWTHEAIAEQLGIEPGTSKSQLSRARAALRAALA